MKKHLVLTVGLFLFTNALFAQCGMTSSFQISTECYFDYYFSGGINGGTPPYTIVVSHSQGDVVFSDHASPYFGGQLMYTGGGEVATLTITDSDDCTYTTTTFLQGVAVFLPDVNVTYACSTGAQLRWTGEFIYGPISCGSSQWMYIITNGQSDQSGYLTDDWIFEGGTTWRYNGTLSPGNHQVFIHPENSLGVSCGALLECYGSSNFTIPSDPDCVSNFELRAFLGGAIQPGGTMSDALRDQSLLPVSEPYTDLDYEFLGGSSNGTLTLGQLAVQGNDAIVDWVIVELRSNVDPSQILYSKSALVQRDGDVMEINGSTTISCQIAPGAYHVAIRLRNHLGVMTAAPLTLSAIPTPIDLTDPATPTWGTEAQKNVSGTMVLWPGDANFNGVVSYTGAGNDRDVVLQAVGGSTPTNVVAGIYSSADINLDGQIKYSGDDNDRDIILQTIGGVVPTAVKMGQVP